VLHGLPVVIRTAKPVTCGYDDVVRVATDCQARLVYLMPTLGPHGRVLGHADRSHLARALAGSSLLAVDDISQAGLTFEPSPPPLAAFAQAANLITVGSLTKLHWGGVRLGWIRGPASLIASLTRDKVRADLGTPVLDQLLAVRLLDNEYQIRAERLATLQHAETLLPGLLPDFSWQPPDGGLNLWLHLPAGTASAFTEVAARLGVAVVPAALLSHQGSSDDHIPPGLHQCPRRLRRRHPAARRGLGALPAAGSRTCVRRQAAQRARPGRSLAWPPPGTRMQRARALAHGRSTPPQPSSGQRSSPPATAWPAAPASTTKIMITHLGHPASLTAWVPGGAGARAGSCCARGLAMSGAAECGSELLDEGAHELVFLVDVVGVELADC
jgi:hypothetical protein